MDGALFWKDELVGSGDCLKTWSGAARPVWTRSAPKLDSGPIWSGDNSAELAGNPAR